MELGSGGSWAQVGKEIGWEGGGRRRKVGLLKKRRERGEPVKREEKEKTRRSGLSSERK